MSRKLEDLHPEFRLLVDPWLAACQAEHDDLIITCTLRTMEEQAVCYAQGRTTPGHIVTRAKPGQSAHNYGLAIDIVPIVAGKLIWDETNPLWQTIGHLGLDHGLVWYGAPNAPFHEDPHFEMKGWREIAGVKII